MIIAGDIGGTKCHLAAFEERGTDLHLIAQRRYPTGNYRSFEDVLKQFREDLYEEAPTNERVRAAGFGVPGTVVNGRLYAFNLPWAVESAGLATALNLPTKDVVLLNDLVATAFGLDKLSPDDFLPLNQGIPEKRGNKAV